MHTFPVTNILHQRSTWSMIWYWYIIVTQSPLFTLGITLGVHFMHLDKFVMTCTHHFSTVQSSFTSLGSLCVLSTHFSFPIILSDPCSFTVSIAIPFAECHILEIIWNIVISGWRHSLLMNTSFIHAGLWFDILFIFSTN
jgi:hypothetical protein